MDLTASSLEILLSSALNYYNLENEEIFSNNQKAHCSNNQYRKTYDTKLREIYDKQKRQGGLIDLDEERRRNLVTDDTVS